MSGPGIWDLGCLLAASWLPPGYLLASLLASLMARPLGQTLGPASWARSWSSLLADLLAKPLGQPHGQASWPNSWPSFLGKVLVKPLGRPLGQASWPASWPSLMAKPLGQPLAKPLLADLLAQLLGQPLGQLLGQPLGQASWPGPRPSLLANFSAQLLGQPFGMTCPCLPVCPRCGQQSPNAKPKHEVSNSCLEANLAHSNPQAQNPGQDLTYMKNMLCPIFCVTVYLQTCPASEAASSPAVRTAAPERKTRTTILHIFAAHLLSHIFILKPARRLRATLNPKRVVFGWPWGGLCPQR